MPVSFLLIVLLIGAVALSIFFYFQRKENNAKKDREQLREVIREVKKHKDPDQNTSLTLLNSLVKQGVLIRKNSTHNLQTNIQSWTDKTGNYITILLFDTSDYELVGQLTAVVHENKCIVKVFVFNYLSGGLELLKELDANSRSRTTIEVEQQVSTTKAFTQLLQLILTDKKEPTY